MRKGSGLGLANDGDYARLRAARWATTHMHTHDDDNTREELSADRPAHSPATRATLWLVLLASVGVIVFVGFRLSDLQRDPELEFNIRKLTGEELGQRLEGLAVLQLIAAERDSGIAPRKIERALPELTAAMDDPDARVRSAAMKVLMTMGPLGAPAKAAVARNLEHDDPGMRSGALATLWRMDPDDPELVARALVVAGEQDIRAARVGVQILGELGERARPAADELEKLAEREELIDVIAAAMDAIVGTPQ
jgi:hypothetical protein